jgi:Zn-dependent peptidase ImmA (M78 family)/DNA-binding XRE family transcriptional regulator
LIGPFVPDRLIEARVGRGVASSGLADMLGVSPSAVSHWESGKYSPRPEMLTSIAEKLNLPERFFRTPRSAEHAPIFWRSFAYATKAARAQAEQRFLWVQDVVRFVHHYLEFPAVALPQLAVPDRLEDLEDRRLEALAVEARAFWNLGDGPVSNVVLLLENSGVVVARSDFGDVALEAFSQWSAVDHLPYVVLGNAKTAARSRLDAAHELAHLLLHRAAPAKSLRTPPVHKMLEGQAFRFGSAFLMPANSFLAEVWSPTLDTFAALKERWKVSIGAMIKRCHDLHFIDETQYKRLWMNYYQRGYRNKDMNDGAVVAEQPRLLPRCFSLLIDEHVLTRDDILQALPFSAREIEGLAGLPAGLLTRDDVAPPLSVRRGASVVVPFSRPTGQ